ncbi:hypothetical protein ACGE0T_12700 [Parabacteroides sp. APC149_11_2_Y6]
MKAGGTIMVQTVVIQLRYLPAHIDSPQGQAEKEIGMIILRRHLQ